MELDDDGTAAYSPTAGWRSDQQPWSILNFLSVAIWIEHNGEDFLEFAIRWMDKHPKEVSKI